MVGLRSPATLSYIHMKYASNFTVQRSKQLKNISVIRKPQQSYAFVFQISIEPD